MNKQRRKDLDEIKERIVNAQPRFEDVKQNIEVVRDDEQDTYDSMPEGLKNGERGELSQAAIESMDSAISRIEEIIELLADAESDLEGAAE